ncbi:E3 ubiquitin-protein ligase RGLG4-like [Mizuhopecten yessoensis]|uniref:E3 ubiquitin-protein ligase RGLG2 n=1 Tax=Mizuhopecten yessoensis TaxID=6573 RepID=A0A210PUT7_MIZYE|nr:E3 ubiquitin-protein ligase RGLG4-like [Mizuhopecten yessoensis]OWF40267.1 E3 ubiquitin-protein ligase RGLG2 [Mizuhopecten yessoensis]
MKGNLLAVGSPCIETVEGAGMSAFAVIMYSLANSLWFLLYWLYQHPFKTPQSPQNARSSVRRRRLRNRQGSLLEALGIVYTDKPFYSFNDHFHSFQEVSDSCKKAGLEKCGLIIGVDYTASNEWQGRKSFNGQCLHKIVPGRVYNPYQKVISIIGQTLEPFDDDNIIPAYGFGDSVTLGDKVFPLFNDDWMCRGFKEVLECYSNMASKLILSGPTNFAPLIHQAIDIVKKTGTYHILIVIADGQVNEEEHTIDAIIQASKYPLSIVVVGVGDGPWDLMEEFDNHLPSRTFDNFQFVNYHEATSKSKHPDANLALHVMMEIPLQYKTIKAMGYLKNSKSSATDNSGKKTQSSGMEKTLDFRRVRSATSDKSLGSSVEKLRDINGSKSLDANWDKSQGTKRDRSQSANLDKSRGSDRERPSSMVCSKSQLEVSENSVNVSHQTDV